MSNRTTEEKWDAEVERWTPRRVKAWVAIFVIVILFGGVAAWGLRVATSDTKGRGDQITRNNSEVNRTEQQARFLKLYNGIKSLDKRIDFAADALEADQQAGRDTRISEANLSGVQNLCVKAIGDYNSATREILAKDWREPDLPQEIDESDPNTDCLPTAA